MHNQTYPVVGDATARLLGGNGPVRIVKLFASKAEEPYRTSIEDTYEVWLKEHVDHVAKEAGHLLSEIHARKGVDAQGNAVFITSFHFASEAAMATYNQQFVKPMVALIEASYPDAISKQAFPYQRRELHGQEITQLDAVLAEGTTGPLTTINRITAAPSLSRHGNAAIYNPQKSALGI